MHFASPLALLALTSSTLASIYITNPVASTSEKGGSTWTIEWQAVSGPFGVYGIAAPSGRRRCPLPRAPAGPASVRSTGKRAGRVERRREGRDDPTWVLMGC